MVSVSAPKVTPDPEYKICVRPTKDDMKIILALHAKLGVDNSQIFRLSIRALAAKEGVTP